MLATLRINMKTYILILILALTVGQPISANAGILSGLAKVAKKADAPDVAPTKLADIDTKLLKIPDADGAQLVNAKLDANKEWVFSSANNTPIINLDTLNNPVIYIEKAQLPRDLGRLDSLPTNHRILLRDDPMFFELDRTKGLSLKAEGAAIPVKNYGELQKAIWHFKSPWKSGPIRVLGLKDEAGNSLALRKGVDTKTLINSPNQLAEQTIVLAGPIRDDFINVAGKRFSLKELRQTSDDFDISLVILETQGRVAPKQMAKRLNDIGAFTDDVPTGKFLSDIQNSGSTVAYNVSPSGKHQSMISRLPEKREAAAQESARSNASTDLAMQLIVRSALISRPSKERQQELDSTFLFGIPNWVAGMYIVNMMIGFWAWTECKWLWSKIWPSSERHLSDLSLVQKLFRGLRLLILVFVLIPIIGIYAAIFKVTRVVVQTIWSMLKSIYSFFNWHPNKLSNKPK